MSASFAQAAAVEVDIRAAGNKRYQAFVEADLDTDTDAFYNKKKRALILDANPLLTGS